MAISLSVVIPVRNGAATLARQVEALRPQLRAGTEVVIVDNGSTDGTADLVAGYLGLDPHIRLVSEPERGVNRARNSGVRASLGDLILLCDADDEVQPGWLDAMRRALESADLVGSPVNPVAEDGTPWPYDTRRFNRWGFGAPFGCSCGFTRSAWTVAGGFDDKMTGGYDDLDFFLRAQLLGCTLAWANDASVVYTLSTDPSKQLRRRRENDVNSRRSYWMGRRMGYPADPQLARDLWYLASRAPLTAFSAPRRRGWLLILTRRWDRCRGFFRFGLRELLKRRQPPTAALSTGRAGPGSSPPSPGPPSSTSR